MKKSWGLLPKIVTGEKTIESRWYMNRSAPWGKIKKGDLVYLKNSGQPVTVMAEVARVIQFSNLTPSTVNKIITQYGMKDGLIKNDLPHYYKMFKNKKYCILVFLRKARTVKPFNVNKKRYGAMAAWLMTSDIRKIKTYELERHSRG